METIRTNHNIFQEVVLYWHSYMPLQNDNHLRMIIMLQWHIAVSCDHVIAWDHIITISIKKIINIKYIIIIILCNATIFQPLIWYIYVYYISHIWKHICRHIVTPSNKVPRFSVVTCFVFVTWVNVLWNMLILIVVMETTRTNHKHFQVDLHWHSYMPQQNDNHLRMIIMLQWHIAVSCDHV